MPEAIKQLKERNQQDYQQANYQQQANVQRPATYSQQNNQQQQQQRSASQPQQRQARVQQPSTSNYQQTYQAQKQPSGSAVQGPNLYEEKFHSEFSFISLILGIFGLILPLFSTLAIIFGIGGLMQTNREQMKGRWMAVAGIILGFLGIALIIIAIIFGISFLENYLLQLGGVDTLIGEAHNLVG